jgi:hypothetical protein
MINDLLTYEEDVDERIISTSAACGALESYLANNQINFKARGPAYSTLNLIILLHLPPYFTCQPS